MSFMGPGENGKEITYQNTSATAVSSLVVMVVYENECVLIITHTPALKKVISISF